MKPSKENTALRKTAKSDCNRSFTRLARWVADNCGNSPGIAMSYGFNVGKAVREAGQKPDQLIILEWWYSAPGMVSFRVSAAKGNKVRYYVACRLNNTDDPFVICGDDTKSYAVTAKGLVRGKEYVFMLYASNTKGEGVPVFTAPIIAAI